MLSGIRFAFWRNNSDSHKGWPKDASWAEVPTRFRIEAKAGDGQGEDGRGGQSPSTYSSSLGSCVSIGDGCPNQYIERECFALVHARYKSRLSNSESTKFLSWTPAMITASNSSPLVSCIGDTISFWFISSSISRSWTPLYPLWPSSLKMVLASPSHFVKMATVQSSCPARSCEKRWIIASCIALNVSDLFPFSFSPYLW